MDINIIRNIVVYFYATLGFYVTAILSLHNELRNVPFSSTAMHHLQMGIVTEKFVVRLFFPYVNISECIYTNLDDIAVCLDYILYCF